MSKPNIIDKLKLFLERHQLFGEECQVVYLMVEIRKVLEHEGDENVLLSYPLLKFYSDWILHTEKSHITPEIQQILTRIEKELPNLGEKFGPLNESANFGFVRMEELAKELKLFLANYGLPLELIDDSESWGIFLELLIGILADQPILPRKGNVKSFSFEPADKGVARWHIELHNQRRGRYTFNIALFEPKTV